MLLARSRGAARMMKSTIRTNLFSRMSCFGRLTLSQRYQILCALISTSALALLYLHANDPIPVQNLFKLATGYGLALGLLTSALIILHFITSRIVTLRNLNVDQTSFYKSYAIGFPGSDILVGLAAFTVTLSSFTAYKSMVVGASGYRYDDAIIALDRYIFAGHDPWQLTHALLPSAIATQVLDFLYYPGFFPMIAGFVASLGLRARPELRYTYIVAFLASFVLIGMIGANILSSAGPIFDGIIFGDGTIFAELIARLEQQSLQAGPFYSSMTQHYLIEAHGQSTTLLGTGISAMPSMHIVMAFLCAFGGWRLHKTLGICLTVHALVIWLASIHLGWHYFSDGLVALAILIPIWLKSEAILRPTVG